MYDYDVSGKRTFILNLHFNNINRYASSKPLSYGGFEFVKWFQWLLNINYDKESDMGYALMFDVSYHVYIKPLHRD